MNNNDMKKFILILFVVIAFTACEEFKYGSLILNGDFSKLKVKVKDKEIKRSSF